MDVLPILKELNLVRVDVSCVSGEISKSDSRARTDDAFTEGSVRYIDRSLLSPFVSTRGAAARLCCAHGTRFLGNWAVPNTQLAKVRDEITDLITTFEQQRQDLSGHVSDALTEWAVKHPEVAPWASRFPSPAAVLAGISIRASAYKLDPKSVGVDGTAHDGIQDAIRGLAGQILDEVAQDAKSAFSASAAKASNKARGVLSRMLGKLDSMAFVDPSLSSVAQVIRDTVAALPSSGPMRGHDFAVYSGLMNALMCPSRVLEIAKVASAYSTPDQWFGIADTAIVTPRTEVAAPTGPEHDRVDPEVAVVIQHTDDASAAAPAQSGNTEPDPQQTVPAPVTVPPPAPAASTGVGNWDW